MASLAGSWAQLPRSRGPRADEVGVRRAQDQRSGSSTCSGSRGATGAAVSRFSSRVTACSATCSIGWRTLERPRAAATGVSSKPITGTSALASGSPRARRRRRHRQRVARADQRGGAAGEQVAGSPGALGHLVLDAEGEARRSPGRPRRRRGRVATLARRSSPTPDPAGQPRNPTRRWPRSSRWTVASDVPDPPSTSTHGAAHRTGPRYSTAGRRRRRVRRARAARRRGVVVVGAGEHEAVDVGDRQQLVDRGELSFVVGAVNRVSR